MMIIETRLVILLAILITINIIPIIGIIRSAFVFRYRMSLIKKISVAAQEDIGNRVFDFMCRYDYFNKISYGQMLFKFWRSFLKSFYKEYDFLYPKNN